MIAKKLNKTVITHRVPPTHKPALKLNTLTSSWVDFFHTQCECAYMFYQAHTHRPFAILYILFCLISVNELKTMEQKLNV